MSVALCAPTGRAAARLSEATGRPAVTVHKLLGAKMDGSYGSESIAADLVVVDEASLVDLFLLEELLGRLRDGAHLILVGDQEQLGSVGPGAVLRDCIESAKVPGMRLGVVQRQAAESGIVRLARGIARGKLPAIADYEILPNADVSFWDAGSPEEIGESIVQLFNRGHQIITPRRTGRWGSEEISDLIRNQSLMRRGGLVVGDLVRLRGGDYAWRGAGLGAGALGRVVSCRGAYGNKTAVVDFAGKEIEYPERHWSRLCHGWASTIHTAQGSEFEAVGLLLHPSAGRLLARNVLYTAATRAKSRLVLFGERASLRAAVASLGTSRRTRLRNLLAGS